MRNNKQVKGFRQKSFCFKIFSLPREARLFLQVKFELNLEGFCSHDDAFQMGNYKQHLIWQKITRLFPLTSELFRFYRINYLIPTLVTCLHLKVGRYIHHLSYYALCDMHTVPNRAKNCLLIHSYDEKGIWVYAWSF